MNRKSLCLSLMAGLMCTSAYALNTFVTEPVSTNEVGTVEVGLTPTYRIDEFEFEGVTGDYTDSFMRVDATGRWVPAEKWEVLLDVPYVSDKFESDVSGVSTSDSDSGIGQVILGGKYSFHPNLGVAVRAELPTADQDKQLGEGTNYGLSLLAERAFGPITLIGNVGYLMKSEYNTTFDTPGAADTKVDPGELLQLNLAAVHNRWGIDWVGEVNVNMIGEEEVDSVSDSESDGTAIDVILGGSKVLAEDWRLKAAVALGVGEEDFRSLDTTRGAGDYKVILAGEYKFALGK